MTNKQGQQDREKGNRDQEFWTDLISTSTPFEISCLADAITDSQERFLTTNLIEDFIDTCDTDMLCTIIISIASRADSVDALRYVNQDGWCYEGKIEVRKLIEERKRQIKLKL
jgi:hypothetical protein